MTMKALGAAALLSLSILPALSAQAVSPEAAAAFDPGILAKSEPIPELQYRGTSAPVTLSNGSGDGSLSITVDGYGSFGSSTPAGNAFYDPIGTLAASGTVYESGLFFSELGDFLTTDTFGAALPPVAFTAVGSDFAQSSFAVSGFQFDLTQRINPIGAGGTSFVQTYTITNNTGLAQEVLLVRHVDGDLLFDGTLQDRGGVSGDVLFEFDDGDDPQVASTFVGIQGSGGTATGFAIQPFRFTDDIQTAGGIPPSLINQIFNDLNGDGITDMSFDVTLSQQHELTIPAGSSVTHTTTTIFGSGSTEDLAIQAVDPACSQAASCQGEFLRETSAGVFPVDDVEQLIAASVSRSGAVADGVTQVLLRVDTDAPVTLTFELQQTNGVEGPCAWGTLLQRDGTGASCTSIQIEPESTSDGMRAFAVYRAPANFPLPGDASVASLRILATSGSGLAGADLEIRRPPVVLVHGVWSGPDAWRDPGSGLRGFLQAAGFEVTLVDHSDIEDSAGSFDPKPESAVIERLITSTELALRGLRLQNVAVSQVDVVGHSMGGLITRARSVYSRSPYQRLVNYKGGDFHKLITIGTPHRGTPLADFLLSHRCDQLSKLWFDPTIEGFFETIGKPLGPAVYGFQTASKAIVNIGATQAIPSRAIVGLAPTASDTEGHLNRLFDWSCNNSSIDGLLGAEHDTIVDKTSQQGGLATSSISAVSDVVHAAVEFDPGPNEDTAETESMTVWNQVLQGLRASLEDLEFGSFTALTSTGMPIQPGTCQPIDRCPPEAGPTPEPARGVATSILPAPGALFAPGEPVLIELTVDGGNPVDGSLFIVDGEFSVVEGSSPFQATFPTSAATAGRVEALVGTFGGVPENYGAATHFFVLPTELPDSLAATPSSLELLEGSSYPLRVEGTYPGGLVIDITSGSAGTSYSTLSGGNEIASISADGIVTGNGVGTDTVLIDNSGVTTAVQVSVLKREFIFLDGFESGDLSRWSDSVGLSTRGPGGTP